MTYQATLVFSALFSATAAAAYAYVGQRVRSHAVGDPGPQRALLMLSVWWFALGVAAFLSALTTAAAGLATIGVPLLTSVAHLNALAVCLALWGLLYYLVYLFTGRQGLFLPMGIFYAGTFVWLVYLVTAADPTGVIVDRWRVQLEYARPIAGSATMPFLVAVILVPQLAGAAAYFSLAFRLKDPSKRFRAAVVGGAIFVWFATTLVVSGSGVAASDAWQVGSRALGLAAALAVLVAYEPPGWVQRRFGVRPFENATREAPGRA